MPIDADRRDVKFDVDIKWRAVSAFEILLSYNEIHIVSSDMISDWRWWD
jgi:hypothetical protein